MFSHLLQINIRQHQATSGNDIPKIPLEVLANGDILTEEIDDKEEEEENKG